MGTAASAMTFCGGHGFDLLSGQAGSAPGAVTLTGTTSSVLAAPAAIADTGKPVTFTGTLRTVGRTGLAGGVLTIEERRPAAGWTAVSSLTTGKGGWGGGLREQPADSESSGEWAGGSIGVKPRRLFGWCYAAPGCSRAVR